MNDNKFIKKLVEENIAVHFKCVDDREKYFEILDKLKYQANRDNRFKVSFSKRQNEVCCELKRYNKYQGASDYVRCFGFIDEYDRDIYEVWDINKFLDEYNKSENE